MKLKTLKRQPYFLQTPDLRWFINHQWLFYFVTTLGLPFEIAVESFVTLAEKYGLKDGKYGIQNGIQK